jgi:hypothetical protein
VTISETKPGDPPLEPLHDDGKKSGGAKMPDGDHQTALPDWLRDEVRKELQAEIKSMHLPTHDTDNVNVRDDVPGTVSQGDLKGATVDKFHNILGGDTFGNPGIWQDRGTGAGSVPTNYNGIAGAIDYGPDHDEPPQSSGREERNTQHPIHTDPAAHGDGGGGNAQNTSGSLALSLIETATQEAAHQRDPWGTRGRYEQAADAPKDVAETPGQKAAHELQDALDRHDGPSQHEPIKSQEKLPGADLGGSLGHGPGHGGGLEADAASGFADLIRAAQNPREFGLAATAHVTTPDAVPHLAMNADLAGHLLPSHGTEDAHAAAASAIAVHDVHLDHHAVAMPVVDHIVAAHH